MILTILFAALASPGLARAQTSPPPLPPSFYGEVRIAGQYAPPGTTVAAQIGGHVFATSTVSLFQGKSVYSLDVPGDDSDTNTVLEGGAAGETVRFLVGGAPAAETGAWGSGTNQALNLSASGWRMYLPALRR